MLRCVTPEIYQSFAVYYQVIGASAGDDCVARDILWSGPYPDFKTALDQLQSLKSSHQDDPAFVVKIHKSPIGDSHH